MRESTARCSSSCDAPASAQLRILIGASLLSLVFGFSPLVRAQEIEKVQPTGTVHKALFFKPAGIAGEVASAARDFATFRDPQWSVLTLAQIGAGSADAVTSLNNLRVCARCTENGVPRFFIGSRPDAHKYITAGIFEIGIEAVTAHYLRNHGPNRKWYWRSLWLLPQSFSLFEHTRAAQYNMSLNLR
ncbi:MAG TPA: hypothetical protein VGT24_00920 [Candidatus Acidoferrales bacterium]|nr:hypothetical protein [Candidatus Acidoferrales bacterium]